MKKELVFLQIKQLNKKVISISKVYDQIFSEYMSEYAFFKTIERLTKEGKLIKISKGLYGFSMDCKYGSVGPSVNEILLEYIGDKKGMEIGYHLYNSLNISTQISKQIKVYSNVITNDIKKINNIEIKKVNLDFSKKECEIIKYLEIINNFTNIQDINRKQFIVAMEELSKIFDNVVANKVIEKIKYKKRTIAFLRDVLGYYNVKNDLSKYLSCYSNYKIPNWEGIYESS